MSPSHSASAASRVSSSSSSSSLEALAPRSRAMPNASSSSRSSTEFGATLPTAAAAARSSSLSRMRCTFASTRRLMCSSSTPWNCAVASRTPTSFITSIRWRVRVSAFTPRFPANVFAITERSPFTKAGCPDAASAAFRAAAAAFRASYARCDATRRSSSRACSSNAPKAQCMR